MFLYLDESGDLGFSWEKEKTSTHFTITILVCNSFDVRERIKNAVRKTIKNLNDKKSKRRIIQELKGSKTSISIKKYFYRQLPIEGWSIYSVTLNKKNT